MKKDLFSSSISAATKKNWERLKISASGKLTTRANKTCSGKEIFPSDYIDDPAHARMFKKLAAKIKKHNWQTQDVLFSIAVNLLTACGISEKPHVRQVLECFNADLIPELLAIPFPDDVRDIPGTVYQMMLTEGQKNRRGSYFTNARTVREMTCSAEDEKYFLDPCCGSGSFLLEIPAKDPQYLWGCDLDPFAVFAARINLLLKYSDHVFTPNIGCGNYLDPKWRAGFFPEGKKFGCIAANPPWGALTAPGSVPAEEISSNESFSHFLVTSFHHLSTDGTLHFLLPKSAFEVRQHRDLRKFLLERTCIERISYCKGAFNGVFTGYARIDCKRSNCRDSLLFTSEDGISCQIRTEQLKNAPDCIFRFYPERDAALVSRIEARGKHTLADSIFALGIVTGNNREKLFSRQSAGTEPIHTGKDISRYYLKTAQKFLYYTPENLQQCAREEYYRAPEKLVYKFISGEPVFTCDQSGSLFLNSANILIPVVPGMSIKTVLAFLNSAIFRYYYRKTCGGTKVLKSHLLRLPFPEITPETDARLQQLAEEVLAGKLPDSAIDDEIFKLYDFTEVEKNHMIMICKCKKKQ